MTITATSFNQPKSALNPQFGAKSAQAQEKKKSASLQPEKNTPEPITPEQLTEEQTAQNASALAEQALAQLFFAAGGGDIVYLQKAKQLAQLADFHTSGGAAYSAKGANLSALQALAQASKLEAALQAETVGQNLNQVA
ncbi:hypothetical protein [Vampirovibrio sp.]|uniref:hypothetical protein n=1 Tax=Vampirovibrio sp. TaxID=2717857 RepID=UPI00359353FC